MHGSVAGENTQKSSRVTRAASVPLIEAQSINMPVRFVSISQNSLTASLWLVKAGKALS